MWDKPHISKSRILVAEIALMLVGLTIYTMLPIGSMMLTTEEDKWIVISERYDFHMLILAALSLAYLIYFSLVRLPSIASSRITRILSQVPNFTFKSVKQDLLALVLKLQFIPLMIIGGVEYALKSIEFLSFNDIPSNANFNWWIMSWAYPFLHTLVLAIVLWYYAFGYVIESKKLNSEIKSVDESWQGWLACIICYFPLYGLVWYFLPKASQDMAFYINEDITAIVRIVLSAIMLFLLVAVTTLGAKCSNLTNRGIVTTGPYKLMRHPHYLAKLVFWWITALPTLYHFPKFIAGMIFWSAVYVIRADREEKHLSEDPAYISYKTEVKWRFIPYIY